jgi:hypothetical protein
VIGAIALFATGALAQSAPQPAAEPKAPPAGAEAAPGAQKPQPASTSSPAAVVAAPAPAPKVYDPAQNCSDLGDAAVELESGRRPVGPPIIYDSFFLPAGGSGSVDVGLDAKFDQAARYFAYISRDDQHRLMLARSNVLSRRATAGDSLVKKGLLEPDQTIVNLRISDAIAGLWNRADLYLYTCGTNGSPAQVSRSAVRLSSSNYSNLISFLAVIFAYCAAASAYRSGPLTPRAFFRSLNPVTMTAGIDGKGSLSKLQVMYFSLIVFGLILLFLCRTGLLSELSNTILLLMGITGLGATAAKGADAQRNTIAPDNRAWLLRKGWLPMNLTVDTSDAKWRDLFTTDGEFDVYRYQSFIFSAVVGAALVAGGVAQLASFTIPETLLGVLGLSQVVYIGGKLVTPTTMADLNQSIADLRDMEKKFRDSTTAAKAGPVLNLAEAVTLTSQAALDAYTTKARDVATLFTAQTGIAVAAAGLAPSVN